MSSRTQAAEAYIKALRTDVVSLGGATQRGGVRVAPKR